MQDHNPRHQDNMIYSGHWSGYFSKLEQEYAGSLVRLDGDAGLQIRLPEIPVALTSIEYLPSRKHPQLKLVTDQKTYTWEVNLVWSLENEEGRVIAVEVVDPDDRKLRIHFDE